MLRSKTPSDRTKCIYLFCCLEPPAEGACGRRQEAGAAPTRSDSEDLVLGRVDDAGLFGHHRRI